MVKTAAENWKQLYFTAGGRKSVPPKLQMMSEPIERVSLTIPGELVEELDDAVDQWEYASRSKACRDALRMFLTDLNWQHDPAETYRGTVTIIYSHDSHHINDELLELQHDDSETIIATQHVHVDDHRCLETLVVEGTGTRINDLVNKLRSLSGMEQVQFTIV